MIFVITRGNISHPYKLNPSYFCSVKQLLAIALLCCISYQYVLRVGIVAWYELNKEYVARNLCENRDKPQLKCCGKCYLRKQLNKTEDNSGDSKQLPAKAEKTEVAAMPVYAALLTPAFFISGTLVHHAHYLNTQGYQGVTSIFHPPPVV